MKTKRDAAAACTLSPDGLAERLAWIRTEVVPHVVETERVDDGLALELAAAPGLAGTLERWIALERECCAGLSFARRASAAPGRLRLEIRGIDPDAAALSLLRGTGSPS